MKSGVLQSLNSSFEFLILAKFVRLHGADGTQEQLSVPILSWTASVNGASFWYPMLTDGIDFQYS